MSRPYCWMIDHHREDEDRRCWEHLRRLRGEDIRRMQREARERGDYRAAMTLAGELERRAIGIMRIVTGWPPETQEGER